MSHNKTSLKAKSKSSRCSPILNLLGERHKVEEGSGCRTEEHRCVVAERRRQRNFRSTTTGIDLNKKCTDGEDRAAANQDRAWSADNIIAINVTSSKWSACSSVDVGSKQAYSHSDHPAATNKRDGEPSADHQSPSTSNSGEPITAGHYRRHHHIDHAAAAARRFSGFATARHIRAQFDLREK